MGEGQLLFIPQNPSQMLPYLWGFPWLLQAEFIIACTPIALGNFFNTAISNCTFYFTCLLISLQNNILKARDNVFLIFSSSPPDKKSGPKKINTFHKLKGRTVLNSKLYRPDLFSKSLYDLFCPCYKEIWMVLSFMLLNQRVLLHLVKRSHNHSLDSPGLLLNDVCQKDHFLT